MDVFDTAAHLLALALNGASHARATALNQHLKHDEIAWILRTLVERKLLEQDSSATYWTTVDGVKFLEIQSHMERILQGQKSLV